MFLYGVPILPYCFPVTMYCVCVPRVSSVRPLDLVLGRDSVPPLQVSSALYRFPPLQVPLYVGCSTGSYAADSSRAGAGSAPWP